MKHKLQIIALVITIATSVIGGIWQLYEFGYNNGKNDTLFECQQTIHDIKIILKDDEAKCQKALRKCKKKNK